MTRPGPPGELWLAPRPRPRRPWLGTAVIALLVLWEAAKVVALAVVLGALCCCTGAGSSCSTDDGCPPHLRCERGRCEPPAAPADMHEPAMTVEEQEHAA